MDTVRDNMADQVTIQQEITLINIQWGLILALVLIAIGLVWYLSYGKEIKRFFGLGALALVMLIMSGCSMEYVIVTPPNYAVVVNMKTPTDQAVGNDFSNAELVNYTQIKISTPLCARWRSDDRCPDKLVAEVEGSPQSRAYTRDPNTGTSGADEAICFEASGVNGCVDFSVSAIILREDAKCYANKVGVRPVEGSKFHFKAVPLAEALDTRMIQIASAQMVKATAEMNPLRLASDKFTIFDEVKPTILEEVHNQTCITINHLDLSGGIEWDSTEVQATIDDAIVLQNKVVLETERRKLQEKQVDNMMFRVRTYEEQFGLDAALEIIAMEQWDGSFMPSQWMAGTYIPSPTAPVTTTVTNQ